MTVMRVGFDCPEGTTLTVVRPNGDTFTALIDGTVRIVHHVEVGDPPDSRGNIFGHPDRLIGADISLDAKAVEDETHDGRLYHLEAGES